MLSKQLAVGLAVLAGLLLTSTAKADNDLIRLAMTDSSANTLTLQAYADDLDADTLTVAPRYYGGYRGGYYGGYRGGYGYGGYRGGYYGGYRGGYYGGYRGGYAYYGGYRGGYGYHGGYRGGFYGGYRYGGYYGGYRGGYGYYGGYRGGYYRSSYDSIAACDTETRTLVIPPSSSYYLPQPSDSLPAPTPRIMPRADDGTYPYDGGPKSPVPMPQVEAKAFDARPTIVPYDSLYPSETLVSLKAQTEKAEAKTGTKWNYPAYGEKPTRSK